MEKKPSKASRIIEAIMTKDKAKIKKALQKKGVLKWISLEVDYEKRTYTYKDIVYSKDQMKSIIEELEKTFDLNIIILQYGEKPSDIEEDFTSFLGSQEEAKTLGLDL